MIIQIEEDAPCKQKFITGPQGFAFDSAGNLYAATGAGLTRITPDGSQSVFGTGLSGPVYTRINFDA